MKSYSYRERDYAFGQLILTLRTRIGLTQEGLGERLGVSRRAVAHWEAGLNYPDIEHLQALIALGVQQRIFPAGQEAEEIRALWRAAHQKVLLDEAWLASVLGGRRPALTLLHPEPLAWDPRWTRILDGASLFVFELVSVLSVLLLLAALVRISVWGRCCARIMNICSRRTPALPL